MPANVTPMHTTEDSSEVDMFYATLTYGLTSENCPPLMWTLSF